MRSMRLFSAFCAFLICTPPLAGQTEDPYSIVFVRNNLQTAEAFPGGKLSFVTTELQHLGDGVSIAMLKILDEQDFKNPKKVQACLSLIRDAFSYPLIISMKVNKKPQVTLFFLTHLWKDTSDSQTQRDIQETIDYVQRQTSSQPAASPGM
jgi:hypothetical protein